MSGNLRPYWLNCYAPDDKSYIEDKELPEIDAMEDAISPLDSKTTAIRQIITRFELCYHEADKEAEYIIKSIAAGHCLEQSKARPPERRKELENARQILSQWCNNPTIKDMKLNVGCVSANELLSFIGQASPVKIWQVERAVDRISQALDPDYIYHWLTIDPVGLSEPDTYQPEKYYEDNLAFLKKTKKTIIHDTVDGHESGVSLAIAIDLLMPCHWDFVGGLVIILKAIGGDLHPKKPLACCMRNIKLSLLCDRMRAISNTLNVFGNGNKASKNIDCDILASLGETTPVKRWLAASLDKTIRLHLSLPFDTDLS